MLEEELPDDLVEFLESERRLEYDASACEIGVFAFRTLAEVQEIDLIVSDKDHESKCTIHALDLVKSCEVYDPRGILVYIPSMRKYGSYDSEQELLITYRGMSWSDFLSDPARYVNAAWDFDPEIAEATFSEAGADRVVEVYSAANGVEAHGLRAVLEERRIRTEVVGETLRTAAGDLPLGQSLAPRIWVREGDARRAREIIEQLTSQSSPEEGGSTGRAESTDTEELTFLCQECGRSITFPGWRHGHVETCPHCGSYVDVPDRAPDPQPAEPERPAIELLPRKLARPKDPGSGSRTSAQLWIEVLAVLALAYVPGLFSAVTTVTGWLPAHQPSPFKYRMAFDIIRSLRVAAPVLVIMALSRDSWQQFGIVRPRWIFDALGGCAIWVADIAAHRFVMSLLPRSTLAGLASEQVHGTRPEGTAELFLLVVACGAIGFAEELVMRAYLITRFQRLLSSTWIAVVVTTAMFASCHIYQGAAGVIGAAAGGLVYALAFCWFRRIWPVCIAHALYDFLLWL